MSGRNRTQHHSIKGNPHGGLPSHDPPFGRGLGPMPHPILLEDMRDLPFGRDPRALPPHPALIEERLGAQHQEIQGLLIDNQRLAATHVALKQELAVTQHELQRMMHIAGTMHPEKDVQVRELYEKSMKMEMDLHGVEAMRDELNQVRADIQKLNGARQELTGQVQGLTQDLTRAASDLQQGPALKAEVETMKQELQRARAAIEYEKKAYAENYEQGQVMEQHLITMAREVEKLRAEVANAEKRARAAAAATANPGASYGANYSNADAAYGGNPYPAGYGMNPVQGDAEGGPQYGPGQGSWGAYDMQRAHGRR
ncbi:protein FLX-like 1 [Tasmannia lanceolata]|uniref:protein FLX-like 1 n=1 Tax=Tasmannia lanceolata TaxID=3420 RepID=UPI0040635169